VVELQWVDGWQLWCDKHELRAAAPGSNAAALRKWLIEGTNSGMLIRQEIASMLPVALLGIEAYHMVVDLCAAPGSKTTQVLEELFACDSNPTGVVVANDASSLRSYTLAKRCATLPELGKSLVVTCHCAQRFPNVGVGERDRAGVGTAEQGSRYPDGMYDRVVCDVPCSGDGTTRKHPEVFSRWDTSMGIGHHPLQVQIAMRGAALLKVGGLMAYSTCSYNPIENEAVVAEVLRRCGGALELEEVPASIGRDGRISLHRGVETWQVCDSTLRTYADIQAVHDSDLPAALKKRIKPSMFPPKDSLRLNLHRCVRLLPHRNDTGGFFVALLRKRRALPGPTPVYRGLDARLGRKVPGQKPSEEGHFRYSKVPTSFTQAWLEGSGLRNRKSFLSNVAPKLYTRANPARGSTVLLSDAAADHAVYAPGATRLHIVRAGATVLKYQRESGALGLTPVGKALLKRHLPHEVCE